MPTLTKELYHSENSAEDDLYFFITAQLMIPMGIKTFNKKQDKEMKTLITY